MNLGFLPTRALALAAVMVCPLQTWAADAVAVLAEGPQIAITSVDVEADAQIRIPPETQAVVLSRPQTVGQIATNLYIRRVWADQAVAEGLDKDPKVMAALRVARDKILADAMVAHMERKNVPNDAAALEMARSIYKAKPERFKIAEQVRARHILVAGSTPEAREKAEKLLVDLKAGADFAALAKANSDDKGNAERGGDLGFFSRGRMVPSFEEAAFALKNTGDLSGVVSTKFGYHLIQLEERRPASMRAFDEVKDGLLKEVRNSVVDEARIAAAQALQRTVTVDTAAVEAFSARYAEAESAASATPAARPATAK